MSDESRGRCCAECAWWELKDKDGAGGGFRWCRITGERLPFDILHRAACRHFAKVAAGEYWGP
ncbi:MAG: hypothetical protein HY549_10530 [Elusimicrobia bacterium]|nr:hypothetical protein [Elusimicrobiota bacterium]